MKTRRTHWRSAFFRGTIPRTFALLSLCLAGISVVIGHYRRMLAALRETLRLLPQIDVTYAG